MISKVALQALDGLERLEYASLQWGLVDGSVTSDRLERLIREAAGVAVDVDAVLDELLTAGLVLRVERANQRRGYRSRFAETVRLIARLRQIFRNQRWQDAPDLIADYRIDRVSRRFPRRDISGSDALAELEGLTTASGRAVLASLLGMDGLLLSRFQMETARAILGNSHRGVMVTAGTGAGKTLAFYLPALTKVAEWQRPNDPWTKVVAVYPRSELLKDQFTAALKQVGQVNQSSRQPIRIGTYYGDTPDDRNRIRDTWLTRADGRVCPFACCPQCSLETIWTLRDIANGVERLHCTTCSWKSQTGEIALTRKAMLADPPDVVFATLEMVNRRLADRHYRRLIGVADAPSKRARLILLDEIHLYTGVQGAMNAGVVSRWRQALGTNARLVGLSATVSVPEQFFGQLTGLKAHEIQTVAPAEADLEASGAAYQLVLRTSPTERLSVLSATIQTSFLLARVLDPIGQPKSDGIMGSRVFAFTDDLDVTNRLYDDLRDAEGYRPGNRPRELPLASHRRSQGAGDGPRDRAGQLWQLAERLGFNLTQPVEISRTSSQDPGVAARSAIVVASASLEVGFDDPLVGAVIQHKAPRNFASFLQRRGRAGRTQEMRPWTVTVLSDFGRDRQSYQHYERLFAPSLPVQNVPVKNVSVRRIQAIYSLYDWLAVTCQQAATGGSMWDRLSTPRSGQRLNADQRAICVEVMGILRDILTTDGEYRRRLWRHVKDSLRLTDAETDEVFWASPRSLLLEAVPTLQRRLTSLIERGHTTAFRSDAHPLPDFAPSNLFSELNVPEVRIEIPNRDDESMPITQAMRETAPGRVSRRFAYDRAGRSYWLPLTSSMSNQSIDVRSIIPESEPQGVVTARIGDGDVEVPLIRPHRIRLGSTPRTIRTTSNGFLIWQSSFEPAGPVGALGEKSYRWRGLPIDVRLYLHSQRSPVTVRRFSTNGTASLLETNGTASFVAFEFVDAGQPVALGFEQEVDALSFRFPLPERLASMMELGDNLHWRSAYVRSRVLGDRELPDDLNRFEREWLFRIGFGTVARRVAVQHEPIAQVLADLRISTDAFDSLISAILGNPPDDADDDASDVAIDHARNGRAAQGAADRLRDRFIRERLVELLAELHMPTPAIQEWRRTLFRDSLGQALLQAVIAVGGNAIVADDLVVDINWDGDVAEIWVSETAPGGNGAIEAFATRFMDEPRTLFRALNAVLGPSVSELVSIGLDRTIAIIGEDTALQGCFQAIRSGEDHETLQSRQRELQRLLRDRGVAISHELLVALAHRLLRPSTDTRLDEFLSGLVRTWRMWEASLSAGIDHATFCTLAGLQPDFQAKLRAILGSSAGHDSSVIAGLIWPRHEEVRRWALDNYNPFHETPLTDAALVSAVLPEASIVRVSLDDADWLAQVVASLGEGDDVDLVASHPDRGALRRAILDLLGTPIAVGYLRLYPVLDRIDIDAEACHARLRLAELGEW